MTAWRIIGVASDDDGGDKIVILAFTADDRTLPDLEIALTQACGMKSWGTVDSLERMTFPPAAMEITRNMTARLQSRHRLDFS